MDPGLSGISVQGLHPRAPSCILVMLAEPGTPSLYFRRGPRSWHLVPLGSHIPIPHPPIFRAIQESFGTKISGPRRAGKLGKAALSQNDLPLWRMCPWSSRAPGVPASFLLPSFEVCPVSWLTCLPPVPSLISPLHSHQPRPQA